MASPVKPEPAAAAAQDGEGEGAAPTIGPIEKALLEARERIDGGGSMTKPAEPGGGDDAEGVEGTPPGDGGETPEGEVEGAPEAVAPDDGDAAAGEGGDEAAAAEGGEEAGEGEGEEDGAPDPNLVVGIPARREGDPDIDIPVDDAEKAERLRQLVNSAVRSEEMKATVARVERDQALIEDMETFISTDPVGFIIANTPAEVQEMVAMSLITTPGIWEKVQDQLEQLSDPNTLELTQAKLEAKRLKAQNTLREKADGRRESKKQARVLTDGIEKMVPVTDGITESRRETIIASVQEAIVAAVREKNLKTIDVEDLPLLASAALRKHGIDPLAAAGNLQGGSVDSEPGAKPPAKKVQRTAAELKSASDKRKQAAAGTPPGSGAPAAAPKLPAGQTVEERIALAREKGLGALMGGK